MENVSRKFALAVLILALSLSYGRTVEANDPFSLSIDTVAGVAKEKTDMAQVGADIVKQVNDFAVSTTTSAVASFENAVAMAIDANDLKRDEKVGEDGKSIGKDGKNIGESPAKLFELPRFALSYETNNIKSKLTERISQTNIKKLLSVNSLKSSTEFVPGRRMLEKKDEKEKFVPSPPPSPPPPRPPPPRPPPRRRPNRPNKPPNQLRTGAP